MRLFKTSRILHLITLLTDAFLATADKFGSIDILINNAGILNDGEWEDEIDINIVSDAIRV